jgi:hypothetical protein
MFDLRIYTKGGGHMKRLIYVDTFEEGREEVEEEFEKLARQGGGGFFFAELWTGRGGRRLGRFYWQQGKVYYTYDETQPTGGRPKPLPEKVVTPPQGKMHSASITGIPRNTNTDLAEDQRRKQERALEAHRIENESKILAARLKSLVRPRK